MQNPSEPPRHWKVETESFSSRVSPAFAGWARGTGMEKDNAGGSTRPPVGATDAARAVESFGAWTRYGIGDSGLSFRPAGRLSETSSPTRSPGATFAEGTAIAVLFRNRGG